MMTYQEALLVLYKSHGVEIFDNYMIIVEYLYKKLDDNYILYDNFNKLALLNAVYILLYHFYINRVYLKKDIDEANEYVKSILLKFPFYDEVDINIKMEKLIKPISDIISDYKSKQLQKL